MNLGIEIGGSKLQLAVGDADGQISQRFRYVIDPAQGATGILKQLAATIARLPEPPAAIGVGFGGPVDWQTGRIAASHQVSGWAGFELADWLRGQVPGARIRIENDSNVAALGEATRGVATGFRRVFYVTLGSGIGGGMVLDGQLYHGASPGEAEIGHLWLIPPGQSDSDDDVSGQTIEQTISGWATDQQIRDILPELPASSPLKIAVTTYHQQGFSGGEARFLHAAYEQGDNVARMLIEQIGSVLALGLSHVVHLFHPDVIVLGGGLSLIGEPLRAAVRQALPRFVMSSFQPAPVVLLAKLGENVVPVGALVLAQLP